MPVLEKTLSFKYTLAASGDTILIPKPNERRIRSHHNKVMLDILFNERKILLVIEIFV